MASKTTPPTWAADAVQPLAAELVRRARAGLVHAEASLVPADDFLERPGRLQPALMLALLDALTTELEAAGRELVQAYCDTRKANAGLSARKVMETELGPSMGMAMSSVGTAFGYQRKSAPRKKPEGAPAADG